MSRYGTHFPANDSDIRTVVIDLDQFLKLPLSSMYDEKSFKGIWRSRLAHHLSDNPLEIAIFYSDADTLFFEYCNSEQAYFCDSSLLKYASSFEMFCKEHDVVIAVIGIQDM